MTKRTQRIDELIREEIGSIISRDVADPRIGFVTITDVDTTPDLSHATVSVSFISSPDERAASMRALGHAMPFIRRELGHRLRLRRIPELHLEADTTIERGTRVLQLINELAAGSEPLDAPAADHDPLPTPVARLPHEGDAPVVMPASPVVPAPQSRRRTGGHPKRPARSRKP